MPYLVATTPQHIGRRTAESKTNAGRYKTAYRVLSPINGVPATRLPSWLAITAHSPGRSSSCPLGKRCKPARLEALLLAIGSLRDYTLLPALLCGSGGSACTQTAKHGERRGGSATASAALLPACWAAQQPSLTLPLAHRTYRLGCPMSPPTAPPLPLDTYATVNRRGASGCLVIYCWAHCTRWPPAPPSSSSSSSAGW